MDASLESALLLFMADLQPVFDEQDAAIHDEQLELRANLEETAVPLEESGFELSVPLGHLPQSNCCGRRIRPNQQIGRRGKRSSPEVTEKNWFVYAKPDAGQAFTYTHFNDRRHQGAARDRIVTAEEVVAPWVPRSRVVHGSFMTRRWRGESGANSSLKGGLMNS